MSATVEERQAVQQALAAGQLTVPDPATGYHRSLAADCPADGHAASVWRVVRGPGHAITEVVMRCALCGNEFTPPLEALYLH
jgi:hypothetical protein